MDEPIEIVMMEREGGYGLIVSFSDGTTASFVVEELLELRPYRERSPVFSAPRILM